jgi:hypothetical protein
LTTLLELSVKDGGSVLVEVDDAGGRPLTRGGRAQDAVIGAGADLEEVLGRLGPVLRSIVAQVREAADGARELEVEFGIKLSAESNVIIARAGGEANFRIAMKWSTDGR